MSDIQRFKEEQYDGVYPDDEGEYVFYSDHEKEIFKWQRDFMSLGVENENQRKEISKLKSENENIREGLKLLQNYVDESPCDPDIHSEQIKAWLKYNDWLNKQMDTN